MEFCKVNFSKIGSGLQNEPLGTNLVRFNLSDREYLEFTIIDTETVEVRSSTEIKRQICIIPKSGNVANITIK